MLWAVADQPSFPVLPQRSLVRVTLKMLYGFRPPPFSFACCRRLVLGPPLGHGCVLLIVSYGKSELAQPHSSRAATPRSSLAFQRPNT
jgi:hypothetical protein